MKNHLIDYKVTKISLEDCCGTWCVWVSMVDGDKFRIAQVDMDVENSKKVAQEYIKQIKPLLTGKK